MFPESKQPAGTLGLGLFCELTWAMKCSLAVLYGEYLEISVWIIHKICLENMFNYAKYVITSVTFNDLFRHYCYDTGVRWGVGPTTAVYLRCVQVTLMDRDRLLGLLLYVCHWLTWWLRFLSFYSIFPYLLVLAKFLVSWWIHSTTPSLTNTHQHPHHHTPTPSLAFITKVCSLHSRVSSAVFPAELKCFLGPMDLVVYRLELQRDMCSSVFRRQCSVET